MKKFRFFARTHPYNSGWNGVSLFEVNLPVDEIPEFETEEQALDFYKGVRLATQLSVDNYNKTKGKPWYMQKMENDLPETIFIIPEYSL
jgi:hypothetical protein